MTRQEFMHIWIELATEIADKYYPKGDSDRRGEFLRDQGILYALLAHRLTVYGILQED